MSKYMVDKFIRFVELSDANVSAYVANPAAEVERWLAGSGTAAAATDDRVLTDDEKAAFASRDFEQLYRLGAHPYLLWHFTEAVYEGEYTPDFGWRELVERYRSAIAPHGVIDYVP